MRLIVTTLFFLTLFVRGAGKWESDYPTISGHYKVVGKRFDSDALYTGRVTINEIRPNSFVIKRIIDGKTIEANGHVDLATPDKIKVLQIYFVENGVDMEGTFLWRSDLDNNGRISGYVYPKGYTGKTPGLEALFAQK